MREKINQIAQAVRESFDIQVPVLDMEHVVSELGGTIERDFMLTEFADGKIEKLKDSDLAFRISISPLQPETRQRFSIAHEIGHLFIHMGYMIDDDLWNSPGTYYRKQSGEVEYHANEFAAAFLMPKEEYRQKLFENQIGENKFNLGTVAEYFGVSLEAAVNRGRWLGFLSW